MSIRQKLLRAGLASGAWFVVWAVLSLGLALGVVAEPNASLALRVLWYASASGIGFGVPAFFGWGQILPLWLRGALYGLLAAVPGGLAVILLGGVRSGTLDTGTDVAAKQSGSLPSAGLNLPCPVRGQRRKSSDRN